MSSNNPQIQSANGTTHPGQQLLEDHSRDSRVAHGGMPGVDGEARKNADSHGHKPGDHGKGGHGEGEVQLNLKPLGWLPMIVIALVFLGLLVGLFVLGQVPETARKEEAEKRAKDQTDARPIVATTRPYRAKEIPDLSLPASTKAFQETLLYPRANGYLKTRKVDIGDRVKAGDLLAEIDIPDTEAQLAAAKATLETANASLKSVQDQYELAEATFKRYQDVFAKGSISRQDLEERQTAFVQAKSSLEGAKGNVRADEAEVNRLQTLTNFSKIYAPFDGVVSSRNYDVGALLTAGTQAAGAEMFKISQTDVLRVQVDVPQAYIDQVKVGNEAALIVRNYPNHPFKGKVARSADAVDQQTRTVRVEADFQNPDGKLLPGMYGNIEISLTHREMPLLIPTSALVYNSQGMRVATVTPDSKLAFAKIALGRDWGTEVEVVSGLKGDENIVSNPGEKLADGLEVKVVDPTSAGGGGKAPQTDKPSQHLPDNAPPQPMPTPSAPPNPPGKTVMATP